METNINIINGFRVTEKGQQFIESVLQLEGKTKSELIWNAFKEKYGYTLWERHQHF